METRATLKPGQKGTKKLVDRFGRDLVCVRYRYDEARGLRIKTAEVVVDEKPWVYGPRFGQPESEPVLVALKYAETELRARVKAAGARWDPERGAWSMPRGVAKRLKLLGRVLPVPRPGNPQVSGGRNNSAKKSARV